MNFYNNMHQYYCGIDLHARMLYVCILDQDGKTCVHKEIPANPDKLRQLLAPYIGNIVVGVECMHCWYWVADFCEDLGVDFILGHALYLRYPHKILIKIDLLTQKFNTHRHSGMVLAGMTKDLILYINSINGVRVKTILNHGYHRSSIIVFTLTPLIFSPRLLR